MGIFILFAITAAACLFGLHIRVCCASSFLRRARLEVLMAPGKEHIVVIWDGKQTLIESWNVE